MSNITEQHVAWFSDRFNAVLANIERVIRGKSDQIATCLVALFAEGHLLLDDVPGTGKTTLAKSLARSMEATSGRIQFTPDLLPSDVTGGMIYDQSNGTFDFRPGPVFTNVVLADEINRASPKTQSALLEVMEEHHVTIDGRSRPVPKPFMVVATQNPVEQEGTYRLPEAQLDRFLLRTSIGYPDHDAEVDAIKRVTAGAAPGDLQPVVNIEDVREMITIARHIHVDDSIYDYVVRLIGASRSLDALRLGASTRGGLALIRASRALAATQGRTYVNVDDIKVLAPSALAHRFLLSPDAELRQVDPAEIVDELLDRIEIPAPIRTR